MVSFLNKVFFPPPGGQYRANILSIDVTGGGVGAIHSMLTTPGSHHRLFIVTSLNSPFPFWVIYTLS
jgi:hypothetical protein